MGNISPFGTYWARNLLHACVGFLADIIHTLDDMLLSLNLISYWTNPKYDLSGISISLLLFETRNQHLTSRCLRLFDLPLENYHYSYRIFNICILNNSKSYSKYHSFFICQYTFLTYFPLTSSLCLFNITHNSLKMHF